MERVTGLEPATFSLGTVRGVLRGFTKGFPGYRIVPTSFLVVEQLASTAVSSVQQLPKPSKVRQILLRPACGLFHGDEVLETGEVRGHALKHSGSNCPHLPTARRVLTAFSSVGSIRTSISRVVLYGIKASTAIPSITM